MQSGFYFSFAGTYRPQTIRREVGHRILFTKYERNTNKTKYGHGTVTNVFDRVSVMGPISVIAWLTSFWGQMPVFINTM